MESEKQEYVVKQKHRKPNKNVKTNNVYTRRQDQCIRNDITDSEEGNDFKSLPSWYNFMRVDKCEGTW